VGNDHVRFSLLVTVAVLYSLLQLTIRPGASSVFRILYVALAVFFGIYLHVLAVRTGLVCLYSGLIVLLIVWLIRKREKIKFIILLLGMVAVPIIAYFVLPTFRNRVSYMRYDLSLLGHRGAITGSDDGNRLVSLEAGWLIMNQHPVTGVGFGDLRSATENFYDSYYPGRPPADRILPSSEWLFYGAGLGWTGAILFSICLIVPAFAKPLRRNPYWWLVNVLLASSYLFDIGLEVQYGVFIHAFILLWWYSWLSHRE
jgi:O-antigen ligase